MAARRIRGSSAAWFGLLLLVLLFSAGCVSKTIDGDKQIFTYQLWVPLSVMVGGLIAAPAGWFLRESISRLSVGLMILGPLAFVFGISLFTDRSEVDPTGYKVRMGIFGSASHEGRFDDLTQISFATRRSRKSTTHYVVCHKRSGDTDQIPLGNAISKEAAKLILQYAEAKGIPIQQPAF